MYYQKQGKIDSNDNYPACTEPFYALTLWRRRRSLALCKPPKVNNPIAGRRTTRCRSLHHVCKLYKGEFLLWYIPGPAVSRCDLVMKTGHLISVAGQKYMFQNFSSYIRTRVQRISLLLSNYKVQTKQNNASNVLCLMHWSYNLCVIMLVFRSNLVHNPRHREAFSTIFGRSLHL